jgi:hypothetical protein
MEVLNTLGVTIVMSASFVLQWSANVRYLANAIDNYLVDLCSCQTKNKIALSQKHLRTCIRAGGLGEYIVSN